MIELMVAIVGVVFLTRTVRVVVSWVRGRPAL